MIRAEVLRGDVSLVGELPPGSFAYVDADWLSAGSQPVPSVSVGADGTASWCDGTPVQAPRDLDPDTAAALALLAVAEEAAAAVVDWRPGEVEVIGLGLIAQRVRKLVEAESAPAGTLERPNVVVESTGAAAAIVDATRRVSGLGKVLLVGESRGSGAQMNFYPDVHVRGLTLQGIAPPLCGLRRFAEFDKNVEAVEECLDGLARVGTAELARPGALWYRVASDKDDVRARPVP